MKRWQKASLAGVASASLAIGVGVWGFSTLVPSMCDNQVLKRAVSPEGSLQAVVFVRGCGATTQESTQVSIISVSSTLSNNSGNAFVAQTGSESGNITRAGREAVSVAWRSAHELEVMHVGGVRIFRAESRVKGVRLTYETFNQ